MFRILVADDEKVTRRGIVTMLTRGLHEEIECFEAGNGQDALELVRNETIDLIITDICMPLCSGLEFVEQLRSTDQEMTVIIISGYENFEYAKQAVRLGVKDYIMKPLQKEDFLSLVESCIADITRKQMAVREQSEQFRKQSRIMNEVRDTALAGLIRGQDAEHQIRRLEDLGLGLDGSFFRMAVIAYEIIPEIEDCLGFVVKNISDECLDKRKMQPYLSFETRRGELGVLFARSGMHDERTLEKALAETAGILRTATRTRTAVGIGQTVYSLRDTDRTYRTAQIAAGFKVFSTGRTVIPFETITGSGEDGPAAASGLQQKPRFPALDEAHVQEIQGVFSEIMRTEQSAVSLQLLEQRFEALCAAVQEQLRGCAAEPWRGKAFFDLWDEFELRREVRDMILYLDSCRNSRSRTEENGLAEEIVRYTREHVTEEIDLNFIAGRFGKTPGYVGALFRKSSGQGFNEFVTGERIRLAQQILRDRSIPVQEAAEQCGYYNAKYFSVVFKKVTGISPKAYQLKRAADAQ